MYLVDHKSMDYYPEYFLTVDPYKIVYDNTPYRTPNTFYDMNVLAPILSMLVSC